MSTRVQWVRSLEIRFGVDNVLVKLTRQWEAYGDPVRLNRQQVERAAKHLNDVLPAVEHGLPPEDRTKRPIAARRRRRWGGVP